MAKGFKHGAGGVGLNFKVVGGTTEPTNPKENMIWVNTDQKITGWVFSVTEPEAPIEGMVWVFTGTSSIVAFNALKKNGIQVYPISAKQYIGGAWVDVTAKSYQGGEWVGWIPKGTLYWDGFQAVEWIAKSSISRSDWSAVAPTFNDSNVVIPGTTNYSGFCGIITKNKVDITGYTKLVVEFDSLKAAPGYEAYVCIANAQNLDWDAGRVAKYSLSSGAAKIELSFTASGLYYIEIFGIRSFSAIIKRIYLE